MSNKFNKWCTSKKILKQKDEYCLILRILMLEIVFLWILNIG